MHNCEYQFDKVHMIIFVDILTPIKVKVTPNTAKRKRYVRFVVRISLPLSND